MKGLYAGLTKSEPPGSPELQATAEMYENIYGRGAQARNKALNGLASSARATQASLTKYKEIKDDPNPTVSYEEKKKLYDDYQEARNAQIKNYQAYRALPEEVDAWHTGKNVQEYW